MRDQLRDEVRAAFQREQAPYPPASELRSSIARSVAQRRHHGPNLQWVAVAAAIVIGTLVVVSLMSARVARQVVPSHSRPSPATGDYGPPPAGVQLIYLVDPQHPTWLQAYDWAGLPRGTIKLAASPQALPGMAPDGQGFATIQGGKGAATTFLDRLGNEIPSGGTIPNAFRGVWADDNRHQCLMALDPQTIAWSLYTSGPGGPPRLVREIARDRDVGQQGIEPLACSYKNNIAIAVRTTVYWPTEVWVIRLSDGVLLAHHSYSTGNTLSNLIVSRDAAYLAENANQGGSTVIRTVSDWSVVATLPTLAQVLAFSGDDSLVLTSYGTNDGYFATQLRLIDWRSGQVVWRYDGNETLFTLIAQPGSHAFALALGAPNRLTPTGCGTSPQQPCTSIQDPLRDIVIVDGRGKTIPVRQRVNTAWWL